MFGRSRVCGLILGRGDWQGAKTPFNLCTPAHRKRLRMTTWWGNLDRIFTFESIWTDMYSGVHPLQWTGRTRRVEDQTQKHLQVQADGQMNYIWGATSHCGQYSGLNVFRCDLWTLFRLVETKWRFSRIEYLEIVIWRWKKQNIKALFFVFEQKHWIGGKISQFMAQHNM